MQLVQSYTAISGRAWFECRDSDAGEWRCDFRVILWEGKCWQQLCNLLSTPQGCKRYSWLWLDLLVNTVMSILSMEILRELEIWQYFKQDIFGIVRLLIINKTGIMTLWDTAGWRTKVSHVSTWVNNEVQTPRSSNQSIFFSLSCTTHIIRSLLLLWNQRRLRAERIILFWS